MRSTPRRRRLVSARTARLVRPFFRYSYSREAFVLRGLGSSFGPVLVVHAPPADRSSSDSLRDAA